MELGLFIRRKYKIAVYRTIKARLYLKIALTLVSLVITEPKLIGLLPKSNRIFVQNHIYQSIKNVLT
jgi:hypothetical protein